MIDRDRFHKILDYTEDVVRVAHELGDLRLALLAIKLIGELTGELADRVHAMEPLRPATPRGGPLMHLFRTRYGWINLDLMTDALYTPATIDDDGSPEPARLTIFLAVAEEGPGPPDGPDEIGPLEARSIRLRGERAEALADYLDRITGNRAVVVADRPITPPDDAPSFPSRLEPDDCARLFEPPSPDSEPAS